MSQKRTSSETGKYVCHKQNLQCLSSCESWAVVCQDQLGITVMHEINDQQTERGREGERRGKVWANQIWIECHGAPVRSDRARPNL